MFDNLRNALESRDRNRINQAIATAVEERPILGPTWRALSKAAEQNGEIQLALDANSAASAEDGPVPELVVARAGILSRAGRNRDALALLGTMGIHDGATFEWNYLLGTLCANVGEFDRASEYLLKAVSQRPSSGQAWFALSTIGAIDEGVADILLSREPDFIDAAPLERAAYQHSVGKLMQRREEHQAAFDAFSASASAMRPIRPFDASQRERAIAKLTEGWNLAVLEDFGASVVRDGQVPIFVTGLPRSGTTLTEQMLLAHPDVSAGAELEFLPILFRDSGSASLSALRDFRESRGTLQGLRTLFQHLLAQRFPESEGRIVDKSVLASANLGMIASVFPDAPILWLRRDPHDNAWSAFSSFFVRGLNWSWSLGDIARVFTMEDRLLAMWQDILGARLTVVDYAGLVTDSEPTIRMIDSACDLAFDPRQLHPEDIDREVTTASLKQVRQPINRQGLNSAEPYRDMMHEFTDLYGR